MSQVETGRFSMAAIVYGLAAAAAIVLGLLAERSSEGLTVLGAVPFAFVLFVLVLLGVALFHRHALWFALGGAVTLTLYTAIFCPAHPWSPELPRPDLLGHVVYEAEHTLLNLGGLLLGFALLARYFEDSDVPDNLPHFLPHAPLLAGFTVLAMVWVLSSFLDNIAAALIGGVMVRHVFQGRVTVGFLAAIIAASNAGGAWSVLGDTTTTMMWIDGVPALDVAHGFIASLVALLCFGFLSAAQQNRHQPFDPVRLPPRKPVDPARLLIVVLILAGAIATNILLERPFLGVWAGILLGALFRRPAWGELPGAARGAAFLLSLVWCASLMPVRALPAPSWQTALGLGFVSAVFDNIPLTKLALEQGGYDWGVLAYTVGFGGSMIWFGSSAGVALTSVYPQARNTGRYLREGWPVALAYVIGFFVMLLSVGWRPHAGH